MTLDDNILRLWGAEGTKIRKKSRKYAEQNKDEVQNE